ncbi:MAG TPA: HAMP domain-containing sensor histidine kinase, partial [Rhizomicrobium sp.]|nr:HAMP domain-containing sensor histidine kinase [Rhizomicrobium sp.]
FHLGDVRSTTTFRLAALLGVLFCCGVVVLGAILYRITTGRLDDRSDQILRNEADLLLSFPPAALISQIPFEVQHDMRGLNKFALLSPEGRFLTGDVHPPKGLIPGNPMDVEAHDGEPPMRVLEVRADNGQMILLGRDINEIRYLERHVLIAIVTSCLLIVPTVLLLGTLLSFQPLRRLHALQAVAKKIAAGEFSLRMPYAGRRDEIDRLAVTVNTMIEDVGHIVDQVKSVTDAVAHDLRTPLTRVRSRLDELRSGKGLSHDLFDTIDGSIGDLDIVLERLTALLRIAELEARAQKSGFEAVQLTPLLSDIFELYQPVAEDADIQLKMGNIAPIQIYADRNLLFEALSNLVDNAIKFGRKNVSISVWRETGSSVVIKVRDDGPGIPVEEREAVLRRFYRRPDKVDRPGSGLGLSVVTAILHLHRFTLQLGDARPGLEATVFIPAEGARV